MERKLMTDIDRERFSRLCAEDAYMHGNDAEGIGTYNEKRLHRILKRYVTEDADCYEVRVGRQVADVLEDGRITEIQTASFRPLTKKIGAYLDTTEHSVTVLCPVIYEKMLIRAEKETGEILRTARSPKKGRAISLLSEFYYLKEYIGSPRLELRILLVNADEYRFSERVRYRRTGAYDHDLRPTELVSELVLTDDESYRELIRAVLPDGEFTSEELSRATGLKGRRLSLAIAFLMHRGLVSRRSQGKKYIYTLELR